AGVLGDLLGLDPGFAQHLARATGRQDREPQRLQAARELDDAVLVGHRQQSPSHLRASSLRLIRYASRNGSRSPSSTPCTSLVSWSVRRSLHIWYGCST